MCNIFQCGQILTKYNKMYHISSENLCTLLSINMKYMKETKFQSAILHIRLQLGQL
jgi:hypothetical protein